MKQSLNKYLDLDANLFPGSCRFTFRFKRITDFCYFIHLTPERKKNIGMFQAFMLISNQTAARCQEGAGAGTILTNQR